MKRNVIFNLIKNVSSLFFPLVTFSYVARVLNPDGLGGVTYARTIVNYFILFASLGVNLYGVREVAKVRSNLVSRTKTAIEILTINLGMTLLMLMGYLGVTFFAPGLAEKRTILLIFAGLLVLKPIGMDWFFGGLEEFLYITKRTIVVQCIALLSVFCFIRNSGDCTTYAAILVLSEGGANLFNLLYARRFISIKTLKSAGKLEISRHFTPMLFFFGSVVSAQIYTDADALMLGIMSGDVSVGLYSAATKLSTATTNVLISVCVVAFSRASFNKAEQKNNKELIKKTFNYLLIFAIPLTIGFEMLCEEAITIVCGEEYKLSAITMKIISPEILIYTIVVFIHYLILNPNGKEKTSFLITCFAAVFNVVGNFFLIPLLAERGAAISTVITKLFMLVLCLVLTKKMVNYRELTKGVWQYIVASLPIIVLCFMLRRMIINSIVYSVVAVISSAAVYFSLLMAMKNDYINQLLLLIREKVNGIRRKL